MGFSRPALEAFVQLMYLLAEGRPPADFQFFCSPLRANVRCCCSCHPSTPFCLLQQAPHGSPPDVWRQIQRAVFGGFGYGGFDFFGDFYLPASLLTEFLTWHIVVQSRHF